MSYVLDRDVKNVRLGSVAIFKIPALPRGQSDRSLTVLTKLLQCKLHRVDVYGPASNFLGHSGPFCPFYACAPRLNIL